MAFRTRAWSPVEARLGCGCVYVEGEGLSPCGGHLFDVPSALGLQRSLDRLATRVHALSL